MAAPPQLIERDHALSILSQAAELAIDNGGCTILVSGEAGVGKTTLVNAVAGVSSHRVLRGACEPLFTARPLGPFVDIAAVLPEPVWARPSTSLRCRAWGIACA